MVSLPDLLLPKVRHFGLSIERTMVRAVAITASGKKFRMAEAPLPADTFSDGIPVKIPDLVNAIKKVRNDAGITASYVAVTFPEMYAYSRQLTLPKLEVAELNEAIHWRIKDLFPLPEEEIYSDWKILSTGAKEYQISVVAVQRFMLDPLVDALTQSGLKPLRFEPDASALSRLIRGLDTRFALLVEINPNGAYLTLVEGEKSVFTTVIPHEKTDPAEVYLKNINQGLQDIVRYYKDKNLLDDKNTTLIVTGEMGSDQWVQHVAKLLSYPARLLTSPTGYPAYNKAFAAVSAEIRPPDDPLTINVLSKSLQSQYEKDRNLKIRRVLLGRSAFIFGVMAAVVVVSFILTLVEKQRLEQQIAAEQSKTGTQGIASQKILLLNSVSRAIVALSPLRKTPVDMLQVFSDTVSQGVSISQWEFDDGRQQMRISGTATTREQLLLFKTRLEDSGVFTNVSLPLGTLETPVEVPFVMTFLIAK